MTTQVAFVLTVGIVCVTILIIFVTNTFFENHDNYYKARSQGLERAIMELFKVSINYDAEDVTDEFIDFLESKGYRIIH